MTASRSRGFSHGLVFSAKPLEEDEIFEVRGHILSMFLAQIENTVFRLETVPLLLYGDVSHVKVKPFAGL